MTLRIMALVCLLVLSVALPAVGIFLCSAILILQIVLMLLRPVTTWMSVASVDVKEQAMPPVFSVHVATHAEPSDLVIQTLKALLNQNWSAEHYEIIVMDNNTPDEANWKPVRSFCMKHGDRLKFLHQSGVQGAKAGALNIALEHTRADATHIVTVDADYIVDPAFLTIAAAALKRTGADYVQFPQSYRNAAGGAAGVDAELEEYFRSNATIADGAEAVLLTGTLCVISRTALVTAGGWSGVTTTEDAEMGVRLCNSGFSGRFINQVVGQGLLPLSLADLEKQRYRWCSGNVQTLFQHLGIIMTPRGTMSLHKRLVIVSQLTAWLNLALVPTGLMWANLLLGREHSILNPLAACVIILGFLDVVFRIIGRGWCEDYDLEVMFDALASRLALAPQSAKATFDVIMGHPLTFVVTQKSGTKTSANAHPSLYHSALAFISLLVIGFSQPMHPLVIIASVILILPLPAAMLTENRLGRYRRTINVSPSEAVA